MDNQVNNFSEFLESLGEDFLVEYVEIVQAAINNPLDTYALNRLAHATGYRGYVYSLWVLWYMIDNNIADVYTYYLLYARSRYILTIEVEAYRDEIFEPHEQSSRYWVNKVFQVDLLGAFHYFSSELNANSDFHNRKMLSNETLDIIMQEMEEIILSDRSAILITLHRLLLNNRPDEAANLVNRALASGQNHVIYHRTQMDSTTYTLDFSNYIGSYEWNWLLSRAVE